MCKSYSKHLEIKKSNQNQPIFLNEQQVLSSKKIIDLIQKNIKNKLTNKINV